MFNFLDDVKIGNRIVLVLVLPILGLVVFSSMTVFDRYSSSKDMNKLLGLTNFAPPDQCLGS